MSKTAQAIKSGVVMGGTAILSAVNGLTPHMAGAIDIMVVQQPDGSLKCSPFYVRFGKYTPMRSKDKKVQIFVNGEEACFSMHLGAYGQAYFAAETMEIVSDADDELLTGMMSPSSGYSSDEEDSTPYANASMLSAVQQEVARLQAAKAAADAGAGADAAAAGGGEGSGAAAAAAALEGAGQRSSTAGSQEGANQQQQQHSGDGRVLSPGGTLSGSESDGETTSSSSSSSLSDLTPADVAAALQQGLAPPAADTGAVAANGQHFAAPPGLPPITTSNGNTAAAVTAAAHGGKRRGRKHVATRVLQVSGDGAEGDPARARLQDLLLDNRYSIKMQSDASIEGSTPQQQQLAAAAAAAGQQQRRRRSKSPLQKQQQLQLAQADLALQKQQQGHGQQEQQEQEQHSLLQQLESLRLPSNLQQQSVSRQPVRHVGFELPTSPQQQQAGRVASAAAVTRAARAAGAAGANGVQQVHASDLPVLLDSAASYSMDEVSEVTGGPSSSSRGRPPASEGGASITSVNGPLLPPTPAAAAAAEVEAADTADSAAAAAKAKAGVDSASSSSSGSSGGARQPDGSVMQPQPTLADGLLDTAATGIAAAAGAEAEAGAGAEVSGAAGATGSSSSPKGGAARPAPLQVQQQQRLGVSIPQQQSQEVQEQIISPNRASLLSSSLKAQQQQQHPAGEQQVGVAGQQQQQQQEQQGEVLQSVLQDSQQQHQQQSVAQVQPQAAGAQPPQPAAANGATEQQQQQQQQRSLSVGSSSADADADATAILDDAGLMPSGWGMPPDLATQQQQQQDAPLQLQQQQRQRVDSTSSSGLSSTTQQEGLMPGAAAPAADVPPQRSQTPAAPMPTPAAGASDAAAAAAEGSCPPNSSSPVSMPPPPFIAASPPVDSGYLGVSEAGALLGTSYEGATPRRVAAAAMAAGAGPLALGLAGFQLSLCGGLLRAGISPGEAQQVFETRRVSGQLWCERGVSLMADPELVVKVGGSLYSWQVAAPMVVGMLAFGGKWDSLLGLDPTGLYPIKVAEDHAGHAASKKSVSASSSWRLWPFTGWREPTGASTKQQQQQQQQLAAPGSSPSQTQLLPPAAVSASASTSAAALQPSGGSFTNLRALLQPGSKSAPDRTGYSGAAAEGGSVGGASGLGISAGGGGGDAAAAGRMGSFVSVGSSPPRVARKKHIILIRKTLTPTSEQLSLLPLRPGANTITFRAGGAADLTAYIYLLRWNTRLVVSDVDGTITRSDLLGHVLPTLGVDWSHPGITQLFHNIARNGYQIMFLSSRAIAQANITREYLHTLVQNDFKMPSGPVIISPHGLLPSLYREIVVRRPHEFKIACLQDIRALFPDEWNPFYAAFGNRDTDEVAYREVGVPLSRTFTINPKGQIQKASTAVQSSTWSSLSAINDLVDEMFPGLLQHSSASSSIASRGLQTVYSSFNDTLELAASLGAIQQEALAAAYAEQQRRRSSSSAGGGVGGGSGSGGDLAGAGSRQDAAGGSSPLAASAAAGTPSAVAGAAAVDDGAVGGVLGRAGAAGAGGLLLENVGPAREEFNDVHFWRPSLVVDIQEELAAVSAKEPQPAS